MTRRKVTTSVVRDLIVLVALGLITGGVWALRGGPTAALILGLLLLALMLKDGRGDPG